MLLIDLFTKLINEMVERNGSEPFLHPVDWESHGLVDYPLIVQQPMDLNTITKKLEDGKYDHMHDIVIDIRLIFINAHSYHPPGSHIYSAASSLRSFFELHYRRISTSHSLTLDHHFHCDLNRPKIKFVALDLDGTLLNKKHELTPYVSTVLNRLSNKGVVIAIATGRSVVNILPYVHELNLPQLVLPAVCYNGALGLQFSKESPESTAKEAVKSLVFENQLSVEETKMMIDFCENNGFLLQYYNAETGDCYAVPKTDEHRRLLGLYAALVNRQQIMLTDYSEALSLGPSAKVLVLDTDTDKVLRAAAEQLPEGLFNCFRGSPDPFFVEFLKASASKGNGLRIVCDAFGVDMKHVVAFGDGENDKEMLEYAGIGVAMKNAQDVPKKVADLILEWSHDEDGVAKQLEYMERQGWFDVAAEVTDSDVEEEAEEAVQKLPVMGGSDSQGNTGTAKSKDERKMATKTTIVPPQQPGLLSLALKFIIQSKDKKAEKEKALRKEILKRQKKLLKEEVVQHWKVVIGDEVPKRMRDISVIKDVTARNLWMEELYLFNAIRSLKPDEIFHAPESYALRWQPPGCQTKILVPMKDIKVQENVILLLSKLPKSQRKRIIFYFAPVTPGTPMFAERVHPASLVSYRTKNSVLKKLSELFIAGKINVTDIQSVFACGHDVWNFTLYNLLPEDEQIYHTYLNERKVTVAETVKALNKSYIDGDISLQEYDAQKFPDRKAKNDIMGMQYPLPYNGETCIICQEPEVGVIKCQNCLNMCCCECIKRHFTVDPTKQNDDENVKSDKGDKDKSSFLLLHHKYCMRLGKLQNINPPIVQEQAWLRKFRETSRTAVIKRLTPVVKEKFLEDQERDEDEEDEEERQYRLQQEELTRQKEAAKQERLAIVNPPALRELSAQLKDKRRKFNKMEKEVRELIANCEDTSHTEQFIARNLRLKKEAVEKINSTIAVQLRELKVQGENLKLEFGDYILEFYHEIDRLLKIIESLNEVTPVMNT